MRILVAGRFDPAYNRTHILLKGLRAHPAVQLTQFRWQKGEKPSREAFQALAEAADVVYLPPFTHAEVPLLRRWTEKPLVFDPLVSRYLTKVFDYQQVSRYSPRALKNYLKDRRAFRRCDLLLADTEAHRRYFCQTFRVPDAQTAVLPVGVDMEAFPPQPHSPASKGFAVGFYGGFIPLQGVQQMIEAARLLRGETDLRFTFIGTGYEFEACQALAARYQLDRVRFPGWLAYEQLSDALGRFDLCLGIFGHTPKASLVIPNKVYHYAATGRCILSLDSPAIREVFTPEQDIVLCEAEPEAIARHILALRKDAAKRQAIGQAARQLMQTSYHEGAIAHRLVQLLQERGWG
jgi:glycosyltransferase involved in cell wall biosynthesis